MLAAAYSRRSISYCFDAIDFGSCRTRRRRRKRRTRKSLDCSFVTAASQHMLQAAMFYDEGWFAKDKKLKKKKDKKEKKAKEKKKKAPKPRFNSI